MNSASRITKILYETKTALENEGIKIDGIVFDKESYYKLKRSCDKLNAYIQAYPIIDNGNCYELFKIYGMTIYSKY